MICSTAASLFSLLILIIWVVLTFLSASASPIFARLCGFSRPFPPKTRPSPQVFRLPQLMLDAPEMSRVVAKARAKLLDVYGDLEKVILGLGVLEQSGVCLFADRRCLFHSALLAPAFAELNPPSAPVCHYTNSNPMCQHASASRRLFFSHFSTCVFVSTPVPVEPCRCGPVRRCVSSFWRCPSPQCAACWPAMPHRYKLPPSSTD